MTTEIKTWQIINGKLKEVNSNLIKENRTEQYDLESWIASNPSIVGPDLIVIGRQVQTKAGPLDLLGIDKTGNIIIIELKRDRLPREALCQAIDYASDVADWDLDKISEVCIKYTEKSIEDILNEQFPDITLENLSINETQRIILIGFSIDASLERMINWLSDKYSINLNAVVLNYIKTQGGEEILSRTSIISEEVVQDKIKKKKFQIPMSDEPGAYDEVELKKLLKKYLSQRLYSAKRIRDVLIPVCLKKGTITREELKEEFVKYGEADNIRDAGYFLSLISVQIGMKKNDFIRQVIKYEYPNYPWEKDNYQIDDQYIDLVKKILDELKTE